MGNGKKALNVTETSSFLIQYATAGPSVFVLYPNDVRAHCPCHEIPTIGQNYFLSSI